MPLFGSARDAHLIRSLSRELMHDFIQTEVELYKLSLPDTETNIYGESGKKTYYQPVRLFSLITPEDSTSVDDDIGLNIARNVVYAFLRDDLKDNNVYVSIGDIIKWDSLYYEVDNLRIQQYWMGRNPDTLVAYNKGEVNEYGYSVSIIAETHMTKLSGLDIVDARTGVNTIKTQNQKIWRNL